MLNARRSGRGFTLIELMIGLAVLAALILLITPSFTTMLQNLKLRGMAESILNGLQTARTEALKRNQTVEFILTTSEPSPTNLNSYASAPNATSWVVRATTSEGLEFVQGRRGTDEGNQGPGGGSSLSVVGTGGGFEGIVAFNGLGTTALEGTLAIDVANPTGGACKTAGGSEPMRCLRIVVEPSGGIRMCDPAVPAAVGDTRAC